MRARRAPTGLGRIGLSSLAALLVSGASCTFGGIADYEVAECAPAVSQAEDLCNRLDSSATCNPFQCDPATKRCVRRLRDDDRDGDPAATCGGGDCDDSDPANRSSSTETCDGKDNTCDGLIDEGVALATPAGEIQKLGTLLSTADVTFTSDDGADVVAGLVVPTTGGTCVQAVKMAKPGFLLDGCSFLASEPTLSPRQPSVQLAESGGAALFVQTSGCGKGSLAYRYSSSIVGKAELACGDAVEGVALPALTFYADDPKTAVALYYDVALSARDSLEDCSAAAAAPLRAAVIYDATSASPALGSRLTLTSSSISIRPPGVAAVKGTNVVLVAAPSDSAVSIWPVTADSLSPSGSLPEGVPVTALAGARSAAIATSPSGVAVAAEIGCPGSQQVLLALGSFEAASTSLSFGQAVEVTPKESLSTQPAVAWYAARSEWIVSWLASGGALRARRFTAEGVPLGDAMDVTSPATGGVPGADGKLYVLAGSSGDSRVNAYAVGCGQ